MNTTEKKKRLLSLYADNQREIERLDRELDLWRSRSTPESGAILRLLRKRLRDAAALRLKIERCIQSVDDARLRLLLSYRYIDGLTWERISEVMVTDCRWLMRLHNKALSQIQL